VELLTVNIDNKISLLPIWHCINPSVHLCNSNKHWFWQNSTSAMHHLLAINVPNFS